MTIADRIEKRLKAKGLKRAEASKLAGLNETYIRDVLEDRVKNPRAEHLARLADVLDTTLEWLALGKGSEDCDGAREDQSEVLDIWDRIAPEDREHAKRALKGFAHEETPKRTKKSGE